jgi:outer membrane protein assembly factor BamB
MCIVDFCRRNRVPILLAATAGIGGLVLWVTQEWRGAPAGGGAPGATGGADSGPGVWPQMRANAQNTGQAMVPGPTLPSLKWRSPKLQATQGAGGYVGPVLAHDGTLFCAIGPLIRAVRPDGKIRWTYAVRARDQIQVGPAVTPSGVLLVATRAGESDMPGLWELLHWNQKSEPGIYALDPRGRLLWKYAGGSAQASPVIDRQGRIYLALDDSPLGSSNGRLVVLSPQGHVLRQWTVPTDGLSAIALWERKEGPWIYYLTTEGALLLPQPRKLLYLFRPDRPIRKAEIPAPGVRMCELVLSQKEQALYGLVVGREDAFFLYSIDATSLKVRWRFPLDGEVRAWPVVTEGAVYVGSSDTHSQRPPPPPPTVTHHHTLYAISHRGKLRWKRTLQGSINTSPAADARGDIYLTLRSEKDKNNYLLCMRPDGTERWRFKVASPFEPLSPPVIGDQRTVYFYGQRAYAIGDAAPAPAPVQSSQLCALHGPAQRAGGR